MIHFAFKVTAHCITCQQIGRFGMLSNKLSTAAIDIRAQYDDEPSGWNLLLSIIYGNVSSSCATKVTSKATYQAYMTVVQKPFSSSK